MVPKCHLDGVDAVVRLRGPWGLKHPHEPLTTPNDGEVAPHAAPAHEPVMLLLRVQPNIIIVVEVHVDSQRAPVERRARRWYFAIRCPAKGVVYHPAHAV